MHSEVNIRIRRIAPDDVDQLARLFHDTIRTINYPDYTLEQLQAWAPDDLYFRDWLAACSAKHTLVAESEKNQLIGFAELEKDGHIDCFYCHHKFQRQGVGTALYNALELQARCWKLSQLYAEVSITAKPFFLGMGFSIDRRQLVEVRGAKLQNFVMYKSLFANQNVGE